MVDEPPRIVLLSLDSFRHDAISPELTPNLWALASEGGFAPDGGRCQLPSVTYPSHATLLTGNLPLRHGIRTNVSGHPRPGTVPGWAGETHVVGPTIFDGCRDAGLRSAAIFGDQFLWTIINPVAADVSWPYGGVIPDGAEVDVFGYPTNASSHPHVIEAAREREIGFVFGHYTDPDTIGHLYGPDAEETHACYRATDALVGEVITELQIDWNRLVLIVLSDHGMELIPNNRIDLLSIPEVAAIVSDVIEEGGCALVRLREAVDSEQAIAILSGIPGVAQVHCGAPGDLLIEAAPDAFFWSTQPPKFIKAGHGGASTCKTLAIVASGHPAVPSIATSIRALPPHLADWAPTIASILRVELGPTDGKDLFALSR
jgi:arylsulfatase A-like enzyme